MISKLEEQSAQTETERNRRHEVRPNEVFRSDSAVKTPLKPLTLSEGQLETMLEVLRAYSGIDFSRYGTDSMGRRLKRILQTREDLELESLPAYFDKNPWVVAEIVEEITVNVTSMFRDPEAFASCYRFWSTRAKPEELKVWITGCSTGEELWTLCILWHLLGWTDRVEVLATDLSDRAIERAGSRKIRSKHMMEYRKNFDLFSNLIQLKAEVDFHEYFETSADGEFSFKSAYSPKIDFKFLDLSAPSGMNQNFDLISCRNVLIYFDRSLQQFVFESFNERLKPGGQLLLGARESMVHYSESKAFREVAEGLRLFEKLP